MHRWIFEGIDLCKKMQSIPVLQDSQDYCNSYLSLQKVGLAICQSYLTEKSGLALPLPAVKSLDASEEFLCDDYMAMEDFIISWSQCLFDNTDWIHIEYDIMHDICSIRKTYLQLYPHGVTSDEISIALSQLYSGFLGSHYDLFKNVFNCCINMEGNITLNIYYSETVGQLYEYLLKGKLTLSAYAKKLLNFAFGVLFTPSPLTEIAFCPMPTGMIDGIAFFSEMSAVDIDTGNQAGMIFGRPERIFLLYLLYQAGKHLLH